MVFWCAYRAWVLDCSVKSTMVCEQRWFGLLKELGCEDVLAVPNGSLRHGTAVSRNPLWKVPEKYYDLLLDFMGSEASIAYSSRINAISKKVFCPAPPSVDYESSFQIEEWNRIAAQVPVEGIRDAMVISRMTGWENPHVLMGNTKHASKTSYERSVFIHHGASHSEKCMPYSWWCEVASALMDHGCVVYWNRGPEEVKRVSQPTPRGACEIIPKDLHKLYTIIQGCNAFAGNDSGPMHLAAWMNKPLYAAWVVADRNEWFPWKVTKQAHGNRSTTVTEATSRILMLLDV